MSETKVVLKNKFDINVFKKKFLTIFEDQGKLENFLVKSEEVLGTQEVVEADLTYLPLGLNMIRCWINGSYKEVPINSIIAIGAVILYFVSKFLKHKESTKKGFISGIKSKIIKESDKTVKNEEDSVELLLKGFKKDIDKFSDWYKNQKPTECVIIEQVEQ